MNELVGAATVLGPLPARIGGILEAGNTSGPGGASTPILGLTTLRGEWLMTDSNAPAADSSPNSIGRP